MDNNNDIINSFIDDIEATKKRIIIYSVLAVLSVIGCILCNHFFINLDSKAGSTLSMSLQAGIFLLFILSLRLIYKIIDCYKSIKYNKELLLEHELDVRIGKTEVIRKDK